MKFSRGPWKAVKRSGYGPIITDASGTKVAEVVQWNAYAPSEESKAKVSLIESAPSLYTALRKALPFLSHVMPANDVADIRKVINEASRIKK